MELRNEQRRRNMFVNKFRGGEGFLLVEEDRLLPLHAKDQQELIVDDNPKEFSERFYRNATGQVVQLSSGNTIANLPVIVSISAGIYHCLALDEEGKVFGWGQNSYGQLGVSAQRKVAADTPRLVPLEKPVKKIKAGGFFSIVRDVNDDIWSFGWNTNGQLGRKNDNQVIGKIEFSHGPIRDFDTGYRFTIVLCEDGSVWGVGENDGNQLGVTARPSIDTFTQVPILPEIDEISVGGHHSFCIDREGTIWGFGCTTNNELNTKDSNPDPRKIILPFRVAHIKAAYRYSVAIDIDGVAWSFGEHFGRKANSQTEEPICLNRQVLLPSVKSRVKSARSTHHD